MIKQNESELANTDFKIQPNKADSFFCFLLFVQSFNCLYLWSQLPNLCAVFTKLKPKQYPNRKCKKKQTNKQTKIIFFDFRLILLDHITYTNILDVQNSVVTSFSLASASLVLNFFCTSLISLKARLRFDDGADDSPGALLLELRYVLKTTKSLKKI